MIKKFKRLLKIITVAISISLIAGIIYVVLNYRYFSDDARDLKIREIYNSIWAQTGQNQNRLPLIIVDSPEINAYNDGTSVVIFTGILKTMSTWDEVALVLAHEIAHGNLYHLKMLNEWSININNDVMSVLEANADKMGAVYMMKAGFDVCKGREWFKTMLESYGDYQESNHPGYAYRYSELNINCD